MLTKIISTKRASAESRLDSAVDSAFFNDIEVKIVIRGVQTSADSAPSTQKANSSIADEFLGLCEASDDDRTQGSSRKRADALPKKSLRDEFAAESDEIIITFFALENDLEALVRGYLSVFDLKADLVRENNIFYANLPLSKEAILSRLAQKDFIQTCEQISLNDKKILRDSIILPFNGSRAKITNKFLEANRAFFAESTYCHSEICEESQKIIDSADLDSAFCARIITQDAESSFMQSFDTNPKNAIYKTIGKALKKSNSLLDSAIFLNFCIDIECLKILLLQKCTFIITRGKPTFSAVKFAQKFGATLVCFYKDDFFVVTHQMRLSYQAKSLKLSF